MKGTFKEVTYEMSGDQNKTQCVALAQKHSENSAWEMIHVSKITKNSSNDNYTMKCKFKNTQGNDSRKYKKQNNKNGYGF